jgi:uncharacterized membrane protein YdbT with pleckstrin-like domain
MPKKEDFSAEQVLKLRTSRKLYAPVYVMIIVLIIAVTTLKFKGFPINSLVLWATGIFILGSLKATEIHRLKDLYEINPLSVVHTSGYFKKISKRVDLFAISDLDVTQSLWQRVLGYGDVVVHLFAEKKPFKNISNPHRFADFLEKTIREQRTATQKNVSEDRKN